MIRAGVGKCRICGLPLVSFSQVTRHRCRPEAGGVVPSQPVSGPTLFNQNENQETEDGVPEASPFDETEEYPEEFDPDVDFVRLMTHMRLSQPQIEAFIQYNTRLVEACGGQIDGKFNLSNASAVYRLREELLVSTDSGWRETDIEIKPADMPGCPGLETPVSFKFHCKNISEIVQGHCSNPDFAGDFALTMRPREEVINGVHQRVFQEVAECDAAINALQKVREHASILNPDWESMDDYATVALLQLYSDKTLVNVKGTSCHPIRLALLNVPQARKHETITTVAYFPVLPPITHRVLKLLVLKKCLETLLEPLREASYKGVEWKAPDGKQYLFFPRILSYVADDPEIRDMLCILAHNSRFPCEICFVTTEDLGTPLEMIIPRSAQSTKEVVTAVVQKVQSREITFNKAVESCNEAGLFPVLSGLYTLFGDYSDGGESNFHEIFGYEAMHVTDLGLAKDQITAVCGWIADKWPKIAASHVFNFMNAMLRKIPRTNGFFFPTNDYFPNCPHAQAVEHRNVLQVLPLILNALMPFLRKAVGNPIPRYGHPLLEEFRDIIEATADFAICYAFCFRKKMASGFYTEEELQPNGGVQRSINAAHDSFVKVLANYAPSGGCTIKRHRFLTHLVDVLRRYGNLDNTDSQYYEWLHTSLKKAYRASGRRPATVVQGVIRQSVITELFTLPQSDREVKRRRTASAMAQESKNHTLVATGVQVELLQLESGSDAPKMVKLLATRPDLRWIPACLQECVRSAAHRDSYITSTTASRDPTLGTALILVNSGVLAATIPGFEGSIVIQTIRSTASFGGILSKPRYDYCTAKVYAQRGPTMGEFGEFMVQVRALFHCDVNGKSECFAFVQKIKNRTVEDTLSKYGCTAYEVQAIPEEYTSDFRVIPLHCLLQRVDLVPPLTSMCTCLRFNTLSWQALIGDLVEMDESTEEYI